MKNTEQNNSNVNDPNSFDSMDAGRQKHLVEWIKINILPRKTFNLDYTSYSLKEFYAEYLTNGEFKGAMLKAGFNVYDKSHMNWCFNISTKSPVFANKK